MIKVLWLINNEIPFVAEEEGKRFVNEGWITGMITALQNHDPNKIQLTILYPQKRSKENIVKSIDDIVTIGYYRNWNPTQYCSKLQYKFIDIINQVKPDIVHVMGSEFPHTYSMCCACEEANLLENLVISIQGLVSIYAMHYTAGLPFKTIYAHTFRDYLKGNISHDQKAFIGRGKYEILALQKAKHVIGRTEWDDACTYQINSQIQYHFNNEVLRKSFYENEWTYERCSKHTIFVSQGGYPIKGLHFLLEALTIVKQSYPDVKVKVAGYDILHNNWWKKNSYAKYLQKMIEKNNLQDNVVFMGLLKEEEIVREYMNAHIFVSPSTIENSPNSVGEAMILGMPVISSDVGGVKDFIVHKQNGYIYPCDEPYMLAHYIMQYFKDSQKAIQMGKQARADVIKIFAPEKNALDLIAIYQGMLKDS